MTTRPGRPRPNYATACLYLFMISVVQISHVHERTGCRTRICSTFSLQICSTKTAGSLSATRIAKDSSILCSSY